MNCCQRVNRNIYIPLLVFLLYLLVGIVMDKLLNQDRFNRAYKEECKDKKIFRVAKSVAISAAATAAFLIFASKTLQAERIYNSTTATQAVSTFTATQQVESINSSCNSPHLIIGQEFKCDLSNVDSFNPKNKAHIEAIYKCFCSNKKEDISNAIGILSSIEKDERIKDVSIRSRLKDLVLVVDSFDYFYLMNIVKHNDITEAVPNIIKRIKSESIDPIYIDSIQALGIFAVKGDWNAINELIRILNENPHENARAMAAAVLIFVNKHVMPDVYKFYTSIDKEKRNEIVREMIKFKAFELDSYAIQSYNKEIVSQRVKRLIEFEKDEETKELLEYLLLYLSNPNLK